jgi:hypothetical protein
MWHIEQYSGKSRRLTAYDLCPSCDRVVTDAYSQRFLATTTGSAYGHDALDLQMHNVGDPVLVGAIHEPSDSFPP